MTWVPPEPLFNPLTSGEPLTRWELLAGPYGLLAFLPLIPLVRLAARTHRRTALIAAGLVWLFVTLGLPTVIVLLVGLLVASTWVSGLAWLRRRGLIGPRTMIALVWVGLHLLILPLWWFPAQWWYGWVPSKMPVLHMVGFSYFLLRIIAWGVDVARDPHDRSRPVETLSWLLYPACMRNGPILLRQEFLERFDGWDPRAALPVKRIAQRLGLAVLGLFVLGLSMAAAPPLVADQPSFFATPQNYTTGELFRVFYLIPVAVYLVLWSYNEIAAGLSLWVGIRVDDNFNWLPFATSVRDFWRRWHVTVGRWLRNYIYIPLGGRRCFAPLAFAAVFGYCAVWHGSSWSFLAWGMAQALALSVQRGWDWLRERLGWQGPRGRWWTAVCWLLTMHYQAATIVVFADFDHLGVRFFGELGRRLLAWVQ